MYLVYKGKDRGRRVNGRPLSHGDKITNAEEVKCLKGHPQFEVVNPAPKAKRPKAKE